MSRSKRDQTAACGCPMCKPWKHYANKKRKENTKPSERRKLQED